MCVCECIRCNLRTSSENAAVLSLDSSWPLEFSYHLQPFCYFIFILFLLLLPPFLEWSLLENSRWILAVGVSDLPAIARRRCQGGQDLPVYGGGGGGCRGGFLWKWGLRSQQILRKIRRPMRRWLSG